MSNFKTKYTTISIEKEINNDDPTYFGYIAISFDSEAKNPHGYFFAESVEDSLILNLITKLGFSKAQISNEDYVILITPENPYEFATAPLVVNLVKSIEENFDNELYGKESK